MTLTAKDEEKLEAVVSAAALLVAEQSTKRIEKLLEKSQESTVKAFKEELIKLGIDASNPIKVQDQMNFLAKTTKIANSIGSKIVISFIAICAAMAIGWAAMIKVKGP